MNTPNHTEYKWTHSPELSKALARNLKLESEKRLKERLEKRLALLEIANFQKELAANRRLENEPKLYTIGQCINFMQKAITLSRMDDKYTEKDLEDIIYNSN